MPKETKEENESILQQNPLTSTAKEPRQKLQNNTEYIAVFHEIF